MGVHIEDPADRRRGLQASWFTWRTIVALIGTLGIIEPERLERIGNGWGEITADEARRIADGLEERVFSLIPTGHRIRIDGVVANEHDTKFHTEEGTTHLNYSVTREFLAQFISICRGFDGLVVSQ